MAEKAKIILEFEGKNVNVLDEAGNKLKTVESKAKDLSGALNKLKDGSLAFTGVFAGLGLGLKSFVKTASDFEQWNVAFSTMLGSGERAKGLLNEITKFAARTPFELTQVVEGSKRLLAYNIAAQDIIPTFTNLGNIAAGVGTDKLPQLITAFGQVSAKGKLMGQELLQFTEAGVNLGGALQQAFGVTRAELEKMISTGKVSFADVSAALESMATGSGKFTGLMEKQSKTLGGVLSNLKDNFTQIGLVIGNNLLPTVSFFANKLQEVTGFFKSLPEPITQLITQILVITAAFAGLAGGVGLVLKFWPIFAGAISFVLSPIGLVITAISVITLAILNWQKILDTFKEAWGVAWTAIKAQFVLVVDVIRAGGEIIWLMLTGRWREAIDLTKTKWSELVDSTKKSMSSIKADVKNAAIDIAKTWGFMQNKLKDDASASLSQQTAIVAAETKKQTAHWSDTFTQRVGMAKLSSKQQTAADAAIGQAAQNLSALMQSESEDAFKVGKAAAVATALVQTYQAAQGAFTSLVSIPIVGPVLAIAAAGAAIAAGLLRVSQIKAQQMPKAEFGGLVRGTPQGTPIIVGERNKSEIIEPLDSATRRAAGIGGETHYHIHINGTVVADAGWPRKLVQDFDRELENLRINNESSFAIGLSVG